MAIKQYVTEVGIVLPLVVNVFNHTHGDTEGLYAMMLTLPTPCISESCIKRKINIAFSFHASLWLFKKFSSGIGT